MWSGENNAKSQGLGPQAIRATAGPLALILSTQVTSIVLSRTVTAQGAFMDNLIKTGEDIVEQGLVQSLVRDAFDPAAWKIIAVYMVVQLLLMKFMPGEVYEGPTSPKGNRPIYVDNCFRCYVASFVLFFAGVHQGLFNGGIAFDYFPQLVASMNIFALGFCAMLYVKGAVAPSSTDSGFSGNPVFDFYWGSELYPRILGWDLKVFTNCRYGMTGWALLCTSFAFAQSERNDGIATNSIVISALLQVIYLAKFHIWERGYMFTIDIMHDRAGYYICWGCLVWVPALYTAHTGFLVNHPYQFSTAAAVAQGVFGVLSIWLNYSVDLERQNFRAADGKIKIWGKPAEYIVANYTTDDGKKHSSMLLHSGWWGLGRKINYTFELCAAFSWSMIWAHPDYLVPWFYFVFLFVLLVDRASRDDARCASKYGAKWEEYKAKVVGAALFRFAVRGMSKPGHAEDPAQSSSAYATRMPLPGAAGVSAVLERCWLRCNQQLHVLVNPRRVRELSWFIAGFGAGSFGDEVVIVRVEHMIESRGCKLTEIVLGGDQPHTQGKPGPVKRLSSPYRGVSFHSCTQRWRGRIKHGSKSEHLGYYTSDLEAAKAYNIAARGIHGINAQVNEGVEIVSEGTEFVRSQVLTTDRVAYSGQTNVSGDASGNATQRVKRERSESTVAAPSTSSSANRPGKRPRLVKRESDSSLTTVDMQDQQFHLSEHPAATIDPGLEQHDASVSCSAERSLEETAADWEDAFVKLWLDPSPTPDFDQVFDQAQKSCHNEAVLPGTYEDERQAPAQAPPPGQSQLQQQHQKQEEQQSRTELFEECKNDERNTLVDAKTGSSNTNVEPSAPPPEPLESQEQLQGATMAKLETTDASAPPRAKAAITVGQAQTFIPEAQVLANYQELGITHSDMQSDSFPNLTTAEVVAVPEGLFFASEELAVLDAQVVPALPLYDDDAVDHFPNQQLPQGSTEGGQLAVLEKPSNGAMPVLENPFSKAKLRRDAMKKGVKSSDPILRTKEEIYNFFQMLNSPPTVLLDVEGYHTETRTSTDGKGNTTTTTRKVTDFRCDVNISEFVYPFGKITVKKSKKSKSHEGPVTVEEMEQERAHPA
ncbi:7-dehydrocholesterol reductase (7-DHC reductase) (Protein DWARF 5) (Sterol Delta(7)-reductase) [Durusdinium trenchii]|uniref:7-dehydrocholesterol reductase n=1 Tax=Durusdinium trenchii TaxID=1381693 RepID=A0ABP0RKD0_9DINO